MTHGQGSAETGRAAGLHRYEGCCGVGSGRVGNRRVVRRLALDPMRVRGVVHVRRPALSPGRPHRRGMRGAPRWWVGGGRGAEGGLSGPPTAHLCMSARATHLCEGRTHNTSRQHNQLLQHITTVRRLVWADGATESGANGKNSSTHKLAKHTAGGWWAGLRPRRCPRRG